MGSCSSPLTDKRPKLPVIHTESTMESSPSKNLPLLLTLLDGSQTIIQAPMDLCLKELKQEIAERYHIDPKDALIGYKGRSLRHQDESRTLAQTLAQLEAPIGISIVGNLTIGTADPHPAKGPQDNSILLCQGDPIRKSTTMSCGHSFTQQEIAHLLNMQLDAQAEQILCPASIGNNKLCGACWAEEEWSRAAGLTQQQLESILQRLVMNKIEGYKQQCPFCGELSSSQEGKRVKKSCHVCESSFCPWCLNFWEGRKDVECLSQRCKFIKNLVEHCNKSLSIRLFRRDTRQREIIKVPQIRGCPRCGLLIETKEATDKRVRCICMHMEFSFCLVCLSLVEPSGKTRCGAYYELCDLQENNNDPPRKD